jgi:tetratricopeptide (TPR) repeat protein
MSTHRFLLSAATLLTLVASPSLAQKSAMPPGRPSLTAGADTNDAQQYYDYGVSVMGREPDKAAAAFYWAMRLNPISADAFYADRCALLLRDKYIFQKYMQEDKKTLKSAEIRHADSLYLHALTINPFVNRKFEFTMFEKYWNNVADEYAQQNDLSFGEVQAYINEQIAQGSPQLRAEDAYGHGRFEEALRLYAQAVKSSRDKAPLHVERGRIFYQMNRPDSALTELEAGLSEMKKKDAKDIVYIYQPKALLDESIGLVYQRLGNDSAAKNAFGQALAEDLSYFPAHLQLAYLAPAAGDTTTALSEMDLAAQLAVNDPAVHFIYGYTLAAAHRNADAEMQLRKALEIDPVFAAPHDVLGQVLEAEGKPAEALTQYETFLALASMQDPRRSEATHKVKTLSPGART